MLCRGLYKYLFCTQQSNWHWDYRAYILEHADFHIEGDTIPFPTPLCNHLYYMVYNAVQPQQTNCPTCGISLKQVTFRPCPNAQVIREHLQESAGFEGTLGTGDKVCFSCYKSHLIILQQEKAVSKDSDLLSILDEYRHKVHTADQPSTITRSVRVGYGQNSCPCRWGFTAKKGYSSTSCSRFFRRDVWWHSRFYWPTGDRDKNYFVHMGTK